MRNFQHWLDRLRAWWHADLYARLDALTHEVAQLKAKPPEHPHTILCPVCRMAYDVSHIPPRVEHVTIVCNNPTCGEHMDLKRKGEGWEVAYRASYRPPKQ